MLHASVSLCLVLVLGLLAACDQRHAADGNAERAAGITSRREAVFRPGQGRLVGVDWSEARSASDLRARAPLLRRGAIEALPSPQDRRTIGPLRADAVVALLAGDVDAAIAKLSRAVELAPRNAIVRSDLAAARLQRGAAFSDPYDFVLALAAANRAFHLDSALPEVRFNLALALQRLSLYERARGEWQVVLAGERDPAWLRAARAHLAALARSTRRPAREARQEAVRRAVEREDQRQVRAIVAGSPQIFRESVEKEVLVAWAEAEAQGRAAEARRLLAEARAIGEALAAISGERMAADTVAQIMGLRETAPEDLARLVQAIRAYGRGVALAERGDFGGALPPLQTALRLLSAQRSPLAGWATYWNAICRFQLSKHDAALALLRPLVEDRNRDRYPALHGRALSLTGLIAIIRGDPTAALTAYKSALADYRRLGETAYAVHTAAMVASCLDFLGRRSEAWRQLYPALIEPTTLEAPPVREVICVVASWLANKEGEREIALWFHNEVVRSAVTIGAPYRIIEALRGRSEILATVGRQDAASRDLEQAKNYLGKMTDPDARQSLEGNLKLAEAGLAGSPQEAIELLNEGVRIYRSFSYHYRLAQALFARARAHDALGRSDEAERDLTAAIAEFEQQREKIETPEERISFFDRTREMLDAMVRFQLERRHRPAAAFRYSEQAKARVLLDWLLAQPTGEPVPNRVPGSGLTTSDPRALQRHLPPETTVIEYSALPEKLVIWVLRQDGFAVETVAVGTKALENLIHRLVREIRQGRRADFLRTSSRLYDLLIHPIARHLPSGDRVVTVPDGALHGLPFALLRDRRTRRYLIQDHVCSVSPSTRVLIASLRRDEDLASKRDPRSLVIVDPAFDRGLFPSLARLSAAEAQVAIAEAFTGSRVLSGSAATRHAFLTNAGDFEIVYFGGHSLVNPEYPLLSQMLFAGERGDPARGVLYSGNILRHHFERTRLAVLASCRTAAGRISRTEGVENLARPFLAAGVPAVVASLWDVDDEATAEFFGRFYGHLRQSFDPAAALQRTQIDSMESATTNVADPRVWAAFELIGGSAAR